MIVKKVKTGSKEYQQNIAKQKFLNEHGVKVKIDGSWGPWQQEQYDKLNSDNNQNWFVRGMIGAAMAENPAVMTASGWKQDKNGNWEQKRTAESDKLADNLAVISWMSPTHPGTAIIDKAVGSAIKYGAGVYNRYKFANTPLARVGKVTRVFRKHLPEVGYSGGKSFYTEPGAYSERIGENLVRTEGGVIARPGITTEMHFNPAATYKVEGDARTIISTTPRESSRRVGWAIMKNLPSKTVIASSEEARAIPQILKDQPLKDRALYYLTGRSPKLPTTNVDGYSTDIMEMFANASKRGNGIVTPSLTTKMKGINIFGKSYNKYSKYFPKSDNSGFVEFSEMTPEQVNAWNTEVAPTTGVYIDPITRLADQLMYITK